MISVKEAQSIVFSHTEPQGLERVDILSSLGRVNGEDIFAPFHVPPWDNSAMDGYAVRFEDIANASKETPLLLASSTIFVPAPSPTNQWGRSSRSE